MKKDWRFTVAVIREFFSGLGTVALFILLVLDHPWWMPALTWFVLGSAFYLWWKIRVAIMENALRGGRTTSPAAIHSPRKSPVRDCDNSGASHIGRRAERSPELSDARTDVALALENLGYSRDRIRRAIARVTPATDFESIFAAANRELANGGEIHAVRVR
jgi:hypothetical protein